MVQEWFVCLNMVFEGSPNRSSCKSLSIAEWMTAASFDEQVLLKCTLMLILWKYTQNKTAELLKWLSKHFSMWENGCRPAPGSVYLAHRDGLLDVFFQGAHLIDFSLSCLGDLVSGGKVLRYSCGSGWAAFPCIAAHLRGFNGRHVWRRDILTPEVRTRTPALWLWIIVS